MYDAVIIPGGGLDEQQQLPEWSKRRFREAVHHQAQFYIALSAGTFHKPQARDSEGYTCFESVVGARYLQSLAVDLGMDNRAVNPNNILFETSSYDTLGNAYFAKTVHTDPRKLQNLLIITSEFHLARTEAIFRYVFSPMFSQGVNYTLSFYGVSDHGIDKNLIDARVEREKASLAGFLEQASQVSSLEGLHSWMFQRHNAYRLEGQREQLCLDVLKSY